MAKIIAEKAVVEASSSKNVEIKHTKVVKDASGKDVTIIDYSEVKGVDVAIEDAEALLARAEAQVTELKADIVEYKKIKG